MSHKHIGTQVAAVSSGFQERGIALVKALAQLVDG
jgi:hypothetical protein